VARLIVGFLQRREAAMRWSIAGDDERPLSARD